MSNLRACQEQKNSLDKQIIRIKDGIEKVTKKLENENKRVSWELFSDIDELVRGLETYTDMMLDEMEAIKKKNG